MHGHLTQRERNLLFFLLGILVLVKVVIAVSFSFFCQSSRTKSFFTRWENFFSTFFLSPTHKEKHRREEGKAERTSVHVFLSQDLRWRLSSWGVPRGFSSEWILAHITIYFILRHYVCGIMYALGKERGGCEGWTH